MKILYLSQYFPPEMCAPSARVHELSREWVRLGHQVTVATAFPNHPVGVVFDGYRGEFLRRETVDGIRVLRLPIYAAANKGFSGRVANYCSYFLSASALTPFLAERPDVVVATTPQFLTAVAGRWVSLVLRVPFVLEVRDLWPRSIVELGAMKARSPVIRVLEKIEHLLYRTADHIVPVTDSFVPVIAAHGVPQDRMSVITNGVDLDLFQPLAKSAARDALRMNGEFLVTYAGTHGMAHGLDTVLDAARLLANDGVRFLLVGEGAEKAKLKRRAAAEKIGNVTFQDQQPRDRLAQIYSASDLCLVMLRDLPLFRTVIPSKLFEFMGSARPILTTVDGESRGIVERAGAGVFSPPGNAAVLAENIRRLARDPARLDSLGRSGRAYVEQNYSRQVLASRYLDVLQDVVAPAGTHPRPTHPWTMNRRGRQPHA